MIQSKPKPQPAPVNTAVPTPKAVERLPAFKTPEGKTGTGVHQQYKDTANSSANVMWRAKVKGRKTLADNIPLHMSLKTFNEPHDMPVDEIKNKAQELGIQRPDPSKLKYEPTIFTSPRTGLTYYMLKLHGTDPNYKQFNDHFKGRGITHDNFMGHITIDKELHDQISKEGIQPHEVEFSPLMIEHGANNPTHILPDSQSHKDAQSDITPKKLNPVPLKLVKAEEPLEKSTLKNLGAAAAVIGALSGSPSVAKAPEQPAHKIQQHGYSSDRMLNAISQVESSSGKNINHKPIPGKMHQGESAIGPYGITPSIIRETIKMDPYLKKAHAKAMHLHGQEMQNYIQDNPGLDRDIAERHLRRLEHHFGQNPATLGMAWLDGITGTKQKMKQGMNPSSHWHSKKILHAYGKGS